MPIDTPEFRGTEKDGTKSGEYCKYCYADGQFTHPDLTLDEMKEHMMKQMEKDQLPADIVKVAVNRLPFLKRWSTNVTFL